MPIVIISEMFYTCNYKEGKTMDKKQKEQMIIIGEEELLTIDGGDAKNDFFQKIGIEIINIFKR